MTKTKIAFSIAAFITVCLLSVNFCLAQTPPRTQIEPSFEVVLQTIIGSNNAVSKADIPQTLSGVAKKLKTNYSYSNYRLNSTFVQRMANTGTVEFKSISNETLPNQERNYPIFSDWTLSNLQMLSNAGGQNQIQFQNFRFGQRVPVVTSSFNNESGKTSLVVNYEQIGVTIQRFSLPENVPTVVGSISTLKPDEIMFLVLTVKSGGE